MLNMDTMSNRCGLPTKAVSNEVVASYLDSRGPDKTGLSRSFNRRPLA